MRNPCDGAQRAASKSGISCSFVTGWSDIARDDQRLIKIFDIGYKAFLGIAFLLY